MNANLSNTNANHRRNRIFNDNFGTKIGQINKERVYNFIDKIDLLKLIVRNVLTYLYDVNSGNLRRDVL